MIDAPFTFLNDNRDNRDNFWLVLMFLAQQPKRCPYCLYFYFSSSISSGMINTAWTFCFSFGGISI